MEQPIQHTDKELELLIFEKLKNILQQQEAIQIMESQQDLINSAITQQSILNNLSDDIIKDLDKTIEELKTNTPTPTTLTDSDLSIMSKKLLVDLTSSKDSNNKKETIKEKAERLVNSQILKDAIKRHK